MQHLLYVTWEEQSVGNSTDWNLFMKRKDASKLQADSLQKKQQQTFVPE